jgi:hypothetical protein
MKYNDKITISVDDNIFNFQYNAKDLNKILQSVSNNKMIKVTHKNGMLFINPRHIKYIEIKK